MKSSVIARIATPEQMDAINAMDQRLHEIKALSRLLWMCLPPSDSGSTTFPVETFTIVLQIIFDKAQRIQQCMDDLYQAGGQQ